MLKKQHFLLDIIKNSAIFIACAKKTALLKKCKFLFISLKREKAVSKSQQNLSRRERQIMDIIYRRSEATAAEVLKNLPDPPSYSAVRAMLRVLEEKGHLKHKRQGPRYVFSARVSRERAKRSALKHLLHTFFNGSAESAVATLLDVSRSDLSDEALERMSELIASVKNEGQ